MKNNQCKMMQLNNKRVLIINEHSFNHNNATAITMRSLWEDWPKDRLFELCFEDYVSNDFGFVDSYKIERGLLGKIRKNDAIKKINTEVKYKTTEVRNLRSALLKIVREVAVAYVCSKKGIIKQDLLKKIDEFKPEVIYTLGGSSGVLKRALLMSQRYNIPIVIHFMDNWVNHSQHDDNKLLIPFRCSQKKWLRRCMSHCDKSITISKSMAIAYKRLFPSVSFSYLMNSVEAEDLYCLKKNSHNHIYVFTYAGGLHLDRWKALVDVGRAIKENKTDAILNIYTSSDIKSFKHFFSNLPVNFYPALAHEKVKSIYNFSDCLIHVETSNPILEGYFKYSISTKIPEYLSTGRLMLFYGPSSLGLYKYLKDSNASVLASNYEELKEAIKMIYDNRDEYDKVIQNALRLARNNHNKTKSKKELQRIINL